MHVSTPLAAQLTFFGTLLKNLRLTYATTAAQLSTYKTAAAKSYEERVGLPPRPKRPLTPYMRFLQEKRPQVIAENPQLKPFEVTLAIAKKWSTIEAKSKQRYAAAFEQDRQEYMEKRLKYDVLLSDDKRDKIKEMKREDAEQKERRAMRRRIRELGRPKKPASSFLFFLQNEAANTTRAPKQPFSEWQKALVAKWKQLPETERAEYIAKANKAREQYNAAIVTWEAEMVRKGNRDVIRVSSQIDPPEPKSRGSSNSPKQSA